MAMRIRTFDSPEALHDAAAPYALDVIRQAIRERGEAHLVLAGGGTPVPLYDRLASMDVPWEHVHLYWGDERCVPPENPDSNYRMVRESLLEKLSQAPAAIRRMEGEFKPAEAAALYAEILPERFDLILLGMGPDGHTASLFPDRFDPEDPDPVVVVTDSPKPPPTRLSLSLGAINSAREVVFLVTGASKAAAVRDAVSDNPTVPAGLVRPSDGVVTYFVEAALLEHA